MRKLIVSTFLLTAVFGTSLAHADDNAADFDRIRQAMRQAFGAQGGQAPAATDANAPKQPPEAEVLAAISSWPKADKISRFQQYQDGFSVNGKRYIDPEGRIVSYGFDYLSGDVTYLAEISSDTYLVKMVRPIAHVDAVQIAVVVHQGDFWQVTTANGKRLTGNSIIPLSRGLLATRSNTAFIWELGHATDNYAAPDGFHVASFQHGDVLGTHNLLIEKDQVAPSNSLGRLAGSFKSLGSTLGLNQKNDYALVNYQSDKQTVVDLDVNAKDVQLMSDCHRTRVAMVNSCSTMTSFTSLYKPDGTPNRGHYFWLLSWYKTPAHSVAIVEEHSGRNLDALDLDSGKTTGLVSRTLGLTGSRVEILDSGALRAVGGMAFGNEEAVDDVDAKMGGVAAQPVAPVAGASAASATSAVSQK